MSRRFTRRRNKARSRSHCAYSAQLDPLHTIRRRSWPSISTHLKISTTSENFANKNSRPNSTTDLICRRLAQLCFKSAPAISMLDKISPTTKNAHFKRSRTYPKTKMFIRQKTTHMFVMASRDPFDSGFVPMKRHSPPRLRRRYSIDVVTNGWGDQGSTGWTSNAGWEDVPTTPFITPDIRCSELEPPTQHEPTSSLPDPLRAKDEYPKLIFPPQDLGTCLELPNSTIVNEDLWTVCELTHDSWWRDSVLDVALELWSIEKECESHGIEIANSMISTVLYNCGTYGDTDNNGFAGYAEEKKRFEDKQYIFLPINDGMVADALTETGGVHWSFVAVDRLQGIAHYVDSLCADDADYRKLARTVVRGLSNILDGEEFRFFVEPYTPSQRDDNYVRRSDWGPCGPFVYELVRRMVDWIIGGRDNLHIPQGYGRSVDWQVDSQETRNSVCWAIIHAHNRQKQDLAAAGHDRLALGGLEGSITVSDEKWHYNFPYPYAMPQKQSLHNTPKPSDTESEYSTALESASEDHEMEEGGIEDNDSHDNWDKFSAGAAATPEQDPGAEIDLGGTVSDPGAERVIDINLDENTGTTLDADVLPPPNVGHNSGRKSVDVLEVLPHRRLVEYPDSDSGSDSK